VAALAAGALALAACGGDDAAEAPITTGDGNESALVRQAVRDYRTYLTEQVADTVAKTKVMRSAIRAGDLAAARAAYAAGRIGWERIEPIASAVEELDGKLDARVDDFEGTDDPAFTGWHRIEHILFVDRRTDPAVPFADGLDADPATLTQQIGTIELPAVTLARGAAELVEEVSEGKITGEENRYAKTDFVDIDANIDGSKEVVKVLTPALEAQSPELVQIIAANFAEVTASLARFEKGDGYVNYCLEDDEYPSPRCPATTITSAQRDELKAQLATLSEQLALVPGALDLQ
jgi:iron uptake system component EfeO